MKKLLPLMLFLPAVASADPSEWAFTINKTGYVMLPATLHNTVPKGPAVLSALWEVGSDEFSDRWQVTAKGCRQTFGNVEIKSARGTSTYQWVWEGPRAYDQLATKMCFHHAVTLGEGDKK